MKKPFNVILLTLFILTTLELKAQKVENIEFKIIDEKAVITYDLVGFKDNQLVEVKLYGTIKGFDMPLYRAKGDVGKDIVSGTGKTIEWDNDEELTSYDKSDMTFKVKVYAKQPIKAEKETPAKKGFFSGFAAIFEK